MIFEITSDDIADLNDVDLRELIGRLCEADLRRQGLSPSGATWGGNQTAKDGGLDVRVAVSPGAQVQGFIPRANAGFQVKKPDMPRAAIIKEMAPTGVVRSVIVELASVSGAYIIVSSTGSTSDSALNDRKLAMAEAVQDMPGGEKLALDFYDRNRIATWVRDHVGLIPWARSKVGRSFSGWRSYGRWSYAPEGSEAAYLTDDAARIKRGNQEEEAGISATGRNKQDPRLSPRSWACRETHRPIRRGKNEIC